MENENIPPVLFLVFNRPDKTKISFNSLRQKRINKLYIHCDGPRVNKEKDLEKVTEVQEIVKQIDWDCKPIFYFRKENVGLRRGIYEAISWFFSHESEGIIIEDDCVPDPSFFDYCGILLEKYRNDSEVMHISGWKPARFISNNTQDSFTFSKFSLVYGWATWRRAWKFMDFELKALDEFVNKRRMSEVKINSLSKIYLVDKFYSVRSGKIQSWAYAWFFSILNNQGLCIIPQVNLVENIGLGSDATNTRHGSQLVQLKSERIKFPLTIPESRVIKPAFEQSIFYASQKKFHRLIIWILLLVPRRFFSSLKNLF